MNWLEIAKAALLGLVQGITEWLPVSSTGHMILLDELMHLDVSAAFMNMFLVVIQLGSILAVIVLYFNRLNPFALSKSKRERKETIDLWLKVLVASVPAGIIGFLFNDWVEAKLSGYLTVAIMLILYGILFILIERRNKSRQAKIRKMDHFGYGTAALMGVFQVLALIPGTSRSGATILGGMLLGASRTIAAEFSFFMAIPVMLGASALRILKFGFLLNQTEWAILAVGMIVAFVVSLWAIRFLMRYIQKHDFSVFGWYRIILGIAVLVYFRILA